jgi:hybrid cluster-associated redox disulfide protein
MAEFTKEMSIQDAMLAHPKAKDVFERLGMSCQDCMAAQVESIEAGAAMHGIDPDEVVAELRGLDSGVNSDGEEKR